jgi:hypothetical protein
LAVFEKALRSTYFSEATRWDIAAMTENKRSPIPTSAWHSHCSNTLKKQVSEFQILSRPNLKKKCLIHPDMISEEIFLNTVYKLAVGKFALNFRSIGTQDSKLPLS